MCARSLSLYSHLHMRLEVGLDGGIQYIHIYIWDRSDCVSDLSLSDLLRACADVSVRGPVDVLYAEHSIVIYIYLCL